VWGAWVASPTRGRFHGHKKTAASFAAVLVGGDKGLRQNRLDLGQQLFLERRLGHHADQGLNDFTVLEEQHRWNGADAKFG